MVSRNKQVDTRCDRRLRNTRSKTIGAWLGIPTNDFTHINLVSALHTSNKASYLTFIPDLYTLATRMSLICITIYIFTDYFLLRISNSCQI